MYRIVDRAKLDMMLSASLHLISRVFLGGRALHSEGGWLQLLELIHFLLCLHPDENHSFEGATYIDTKTNEGFSKRLQQRRKRLNLSPPHCCNPCH